MDLGASFCDCVLFDGKKIIKAASAPAQEIKSIPALEKFLAKNFALNRVKKIAITGGKLAPKKLCGKPAMRVTELHAIALGARFLSRKNRFLVANLGTGTPLIFVEKNKWAHLGGTGMGGGTIAGLGFLLLGATPQEIEKLAQRGTNALDLSVADIVGTKIGIVPQNATASNYGKYTLGGLRRNDAKKADIAYSLLNLVAESVARLAILAAQQKHCQNAIVFTGRVATNSIVARRLHAVAKMFNCIALIPKNAQYATATGAAISAQK